MNILGVSALYHDSAACVVRNGEIIAAAQEERFSRVKHDFRMPVSAIHFCIEELSKITGEERIDAVIYYDNPILTLDRYVKNVLAAGKDSKDVIERGFESTFAERLWVHKLMDDILGPDENRKFYVCEHHVSHAASAFYPSPFEKAVVLTLDGVGEWATTTIGVGNGKELKLYEEERFPHSIGLLYSAFTYFCGFKVNSGDYKFMGLAPYGDPVYEQLIRDEIIDIKENGSFKLNLKYFDFQYGRAMTNDAFADLFGGPRREPESRITKREMDIAASAQKVVEDVILRMVKHAKDKYGDGIDNLVMAGGVALNCVANGKIKNSGIFKNIFIQPAAGDAGGSLGAALYGNYILDKSLVRKVDKNDSQKGSYLGCGYSNNDIDSFVNEHGYPARKYDDSELFIKLSSFLAEGKVIGLFQGRMEFGPRALGNRSIIADARNEEMQVKMNLKIKFRESFRPFAPAVLAEDASEYFEIDGESPYMLLVEDVKESRQIKDDVRKSLKDSSDDMLEVVKKKRSDIPAVTHVDYSARIQTVKEETNPYFYKLLKEFKKQTGYSVLVNTSFNVRGEPIVCTPQNAYDCFMRTDMDVLVMENYVFIKDEQPDWIEKENWREKYELD